MIPLAIIIPDKYGFCWTIQTDWGHLCSKRTFPSKEEAQVNLERAIGSLKVMEYKDATKGDEEDLGDKIFETL